MRIATRLTLLFVVLTFVVALSIGWFAVTMSSRAQYATLDGTIDSVVSSGLHDPDTALANALYVVQRNSYDLTLDTVFPSGEVTQVLAATVPLTKRPSLADVRASLRGVTSLADLPGFRVRSLDIGGGAYLLVAASTAGIEKQNQHLAEAVAAAAAVVALLGLLLARLVMRQDLRSMSGLIRYASQVAAGLEVGDAPEGASRDLRELRGALVTMVGALHERIEQERRGTRAMQLFINDASHELRTPLTVVKGYSDLLAGGAVSPEQRERAVERIRTEVARMESLVRDLLLLAELREAPVHEAAELDLSALVAERLAEFSVDQPGRSVTAHIAPGVVTRARRDYVDRLVGNALANIARHTPADAPVAVTLARDAGEVTLIVDDGGPGLPAYGDSPRRFQRFDESRSRETGGSGLGMSIMADVVAAFGGTMVTEPSPLGGLRIRCRWPG